MKRRAIAIAAGDSLYQLHNDGTLWLYTGTPLSGWQMLDNNPATTEIKASGENLYQKHGDGTIWSYTGRPSPAGRCSTTPPAPAPV
jgi:hypothetical protein